MALHGHEPPFLAQLRSSAKHRPKIERTLLENFLEEIYGGNLIVMGEQGSDPLELFTQSDWYVTSLLQASREFVGRRKMTTLVVRGYPGPMVEGEWDILKALVTNCFHQALSVYSLDRESIVIPSGVSATALLTARTEGDGIEDEIEGAILYHHDLNDVQALSLLDSALQRWQEVNIPACIFGQPPIH